MKDDRLQDKGDEHHQGYDGTEQQNEIVLAFDIVTGFDGRRIHGYVYSLQVGMFHIVETNLHNVKCFLKKVFAASASSFVRK